MADAEKPAADAAATDTSTTQAGAAAPATEKTEPAAPSHRDWNGLAQSLRTIAEGQAKLVETLSATRSADPPKPTTPAADAAAAMKEVAEMRFEMELERALRAGNVPADGKLSELISSAAKSQRPTDLKAFVAQYASLGGAAAPTGTTEPGAPPKAPSDTGAPISTSGSPTRPEGHPMNWPPDYLAKVAAEDPEGVRKAIEEFEAKGGAGSKVKAYWAKRWERKEERRTKALRDNV